MMLLDGEVQIEALWSSAPFFQQKNEPQSACERKREKYERFLKKRGYLWAFVLLEVVGYCLTKKAEGKCLGQLLFPFTFETLGRSTLTHFGLETKTPSP
jgi:hypothetical protein